MNFLLIKALLPGAHSLSGRGDNDPQQCWVHILSLVSALTSAAFRSEQSLWKPFVVRDSSTMPELHWQAQAHLVSYKAASFPRISRNSESHWPQMPHWVLSALAFSSQKADTKPVPSIPLSPNTDQLYAHVTVLESFMAPFPRCAGWKLQVKKWKRDFKAHSEKWLVSRGMVT